MDPAKRARAAPSIGSADRPIATASCASGAAHAKSFHGLPCSYAAMSHAAGSAFRRRPPARPRSAPPPRRPRTPAPPPWPLHRLSREAARRAATVALAVMTVLTLFALTGVRFARQQPGYVGVVRNGGPLDDRGIRQILVPGQRLTWTGLFSQGAHQY